MLCRRCFHCGWTIDIIEQVLKLGGLLHSSTHIISNQMIFSADTKKCISFAEPVIHVLNKNEFTGLIDQSLSESVDQHNASASSGLCPRSNSISSALAHSPGPVRHHAHHQPQIQQHANAHTAAENEYPLSTLNAAASSSSLLLPPTSSRYNVVLLGDSLGDIHMADGYHTLASPSASPSPRMKRAPSGTHSCAAVHNTVFSVGFCNHDKDSTLASYMDTFDLVVTEDGGFDEFVIPLIGCL
jgi:hypothetical protein